MSRARNLKPKFFKNEDLAELSFEYRLLFQGLWCEADRAGRLEDRPKRIKAEVFPYDDVDVEDGLCKLHAAGFIERYEVEDSPYIQIVAFAKHQNPHCKEAASTIPAPCSNGASTKSSGASPADSLNPLTDSLKGAQRRPRGTKSRLIDWLVVQETDAVPADDPIYAWSRSAGIPADWIALAWQAFENRYGAGGKDSEKAYIDWRTVFRSAVKEDWLRLWRKGRDGWELTTAGENVRCEMEAANV
jgi:hypothetical protein